MDDEPVAHMIDIDPALFLNCSKGEIMKSGVECVIAVMANVQILFVLLGLTIKMYILVPLLGLMVGVPLAYIVCKRVGRLKQGKPNLYLTHRFAIYIAQWRPSPYVTHTGHFALGRTIKYRSSDDSHVTL